ncbi:S41 family peptidase [Planctomycetota bacterium]
MQKNKSLYRFPGTAVLLCAIGVMFFGFFGCEHENAAASESGNDVERNTQVTLPVENEAAVPVIMQACSSIYNGDFATASEVIELANSLEDDRLAKLKTIVSQYNTIEQLRTESQKNAYAEQIAELDKFRAAAVEDANDVNDAPKWVEIDEPEVKGKMLDGDVNDIRKALAIIGRAGEFADKQQKQALLSDILVKKRIEMAIERASEFEAQGKWFEAYINCYSWLVVIDPNNEVYSDYAEELLNKANISASFQDSPCETSIDRFSGVKKQMFIRAIDVLDYGYVTPIVDYREMLNKAINRVRLLTGVMEFSDYNSPDDADKTEAEKHESKAAWMMGLVKIEDEIWSRPMSVSKGKFINTFEKILKLNKKTEALPENVLISHFCIAAFETLDPHTGLVWPSNVPEFDKSLNHEFTGIGILISKVKGQLTAVSLLPDTPAYKSGLDAGDIIEAVDGTLTKDMPLSCAVKHITGPAGTKVTLTVRSPNQTESKEITIVRQKIKVRTVRGWQRTESGNWLYMIDKVEKIGYVRLTSFASETADELEEALNILEKQGINDGGLILDLRGNLGGLLPSAVAVSDKFLKTGLIVSTRPRFGSGSSSRAFASRKAHPDYPIVILIDRYSASASEIVAGALADDVHERAVLVGERTHGKGSVQSVTGYPGGGAKLKYTMAYYHLPSGQKVETQSAVEKLGRKDWGVGPDVNVKLRSDEMKKLLELQRDNDVLVKADHDNDKAPLKKHSIDHTLETDHQLAVGVLVLKSKLIEKTITQTQYAK